MRCVELLYKPTMNPSLSIYLDAVRLIAAVLVLLGHAFNYTEGHFSALAGHGAASVAVFFVLSGFVIAFVTDKKEHTGRDYGISRASRMYSVAIGALVVTVLTDYIGTRVDMAPYSGFWVGSGTAQRFNEGYFNPNWTWLDLLRLATFTNELWQSHVQVGSNEPYWSLGFEVWYYVIFGLYLFAPTGRLGRIGLASLAALVAGPKICLYLPLWLLGVACYKILTASSSRLDQVPTGVAIATFASTGVFYLLARKYSAPMTQSMFLPVGLNIKTAMTVLHFHFIGLLFCLNLLSFHLLSKRMTWIPEMTQKWKKQIQWTAGATFTLYLMHQPLLLMSLALNPFERGSTTWAYTSLAVTLGLVFLVAELTERKKNLWKGWLERLLWTTKS